MLLCCSSLIKVSVFLLEAITCDNGLSIWCDDDSIAGEVGDADPEELLACVSVPHPHIVCAARSKQLR